MKNQSELDSRWSKILRDTVEDIPELHQKYDDPIKNLNGWFNTSLHTCYRINAILSYLLNHDKIKFNENMLKATSFKIELFERFEKGDPISPSQMHMILFMDLFDPLASGDIALAQRFSHFMGNRPEIEDMYDSEYTLCMGYCLKYATENNISELKAWLPRLKALCENPKNKMAEFMGYYLVFEAFADKNLEKLQKAFEVLLAGHRKKCKSDKGPDFGPYWHETPDADLFVWGIGLVNLCRYYGMKVVVSDPLIPEELLID